MFWTDKIEVRFFVIFDFVKKDNIIDMANK